MSDALRSRFVRWGERLLCTPAPISAGVCRVAVAACYLLIIHRLLPADLAGWAAGRPAELYQPVGLLRAYGTDGPPLAVLAAADWVARVGVWFLLFGLFTRLSLAAVTIALVHAASAYYSFEHAVSHPLTCPLIAGLGLLAGSRSPLSLDYLASREAAVYWRTPRAGPALAMFAFGWALTNAGLHKAYLGNGHLFAWCYSDNLRNIILFQNLKFGAGLPAHQEAVVARPWLCKLMAVGNVACQVLPGLAAFFVRRPLVRAGIAAVVLAELLGLGLMMNMWRTFAVVWLPAVLLFPDWDAWFGRPADPVPQGRAWTLGVLGFAVAFVGLSFWPTVLRSTFPFVSFPMYSGLMVSQPFSEPRPYHLLLTEWDIQSDPPLTAEQRRELNVAYYAGVGTREDVAARVRMRCEKEYGVTVTALRAFRTVHRFPPAPEYDVRPVASAVWFDWTPAAGVRGVTLDPPVAVRTTATERVLRIRVDGTGSSAVEFEYYREGEDGVRPAPAAAQADGSYEVTLPVGETVFLTVRAGGEAYFGRFMRSR